MEWRSAYGVQADCVVECVRFAPLLSADLAVVPQYCTGTLAQYRVIRRVILQSHATQEK